MVPCDWWVTIGEDRLLASQLVCRAAAAAADDDDDVCVCVCVSALRIHISKPCYIGLLEIGGYEMTLRGEMSVKV